MRVVATYGLKGGVGKTSTAVNLAALSALEGRRTLLWDLDPQGAAAFLMQVKPRPKGSSLALLSGRRGVEDAVRATSVPGLDLLPADMSLRAVEQTLEATKKPGRQLARLLKTVREDYDVVFLDCPPGPSLLSENVFDAVDLLLLPLAPTPLSVRTYDQVREFVAELPKPRPRVRAFLSMVDRRKKLHRETQASLEGRGVLSGWVPSSTLVERMSVTRKPVVVTDPASACSRAYRVIWAELD